MRFYKLIFFIALIWYVITAYFSIGYIHADEHYQIIEFAGYIDHTNQPKDLAWEFERQIRPATQPVIAFLIFKTCNLLSINNPYDKAFVLRLVTAFLAVFIIYFFTQSAKTYVDKKHQKLFLVLSYFIWFLPFINIRFSSETWSGLFFLLATAFVIKKEKRNLHFLLIGLLLGFSFLLRYQIAIAILGLGLWLLFIKKEKIKNMLLMVSAGLLVMLSGYFLDSWFYGKSVITFWNYLDVNLIEGIAASFSTRPWYHYVLFIIYYSLPPIGFVLLASFGIVTYKNPKNIFIWIVLPFVIIHSIIAHKELRFLFPIINFIPIVLILTIQYFNWDQLFTKWKWLSKSVIIGLFLLNLLALLVSNLIPAGLSSRVKISKIISKIEKDKPINLYSFHNSNPYKPWGLPTHFYMENRIHFKDVKYYDPKEETKGEVPLFVVLKKDIDKEEVVDFLKKSQLKKIASGSFDPIVPLYRSDDLVLMLYGKK
jgi:phosphatidylinositol glycan class B